MIPARLGSKRIKSKNLRLLAGKPLVCHVVDKCKHAGVFDGIYINSESDVFKNVAKEYGVGFYKRKKSLASDSATNDMFVFDFIQNVECDIIIQVNPTSPLLSVSDIKTFIKEMQDKNYDTLHSVKLEQIEAIYDGTPLNFNPKGAMPRSQNLKPLMLFSSGIMGWKTKKYFENMKRLGSATYGGDGRTGYFVLRGFSMIDIDNEEDFQLAELAIEYLEKNKSQAVEYYSPSKRKKEYSETKVPEILIKDGVEKNDLFNVNKKKVNINNLIKNFKQYTSWSKRIINTENNSATLICQKPGEGNRLHYHANWNEWWFIIDGKWQWEIEGKKMIVSKGDIVFIKKGKLHRVTAIGRKPAIRLAVSREDVAHIYAINN